MKLTNIILASAALGNAFSVNRPWTARPDRPVAPTPVDGKTALPHDDTKRDNSPADPSFTVPVPQNHAAPHPHGHKRDDPSTTFVPENHAAPHPHGHKRDDPSTTVVPENHAAPHHPGHKRDHSFTIPAPENDAEARPNDFKRGDSSPTPFIPENHAAGHAHGKRNLRWLRGGHEYGTTNHCAGTTFRQSPSSKVIRYSDCLVMASYFRDETQGEWTVWNYDPGMPNSLNYVSNFGSCTFGVGIAPPQDSFSPTPREVMIGSDDVADIITDAVARFGGALYDWVSAQGVVQCDVLVNSTGGNGTLNNEKASLYWSLQAENHDYSSNYITAPDFVPKV